MQPSELGAAVGRIHNQTLRDEAAEPRVAARRWEMPWRRGLGEQLDAIPRRLDMGRRRRTALTQIWIGRYTGARV